MIESLKDALMKDDVNLLKNAIQKYNPDGSELKAALYYSCKQGKLNCSIYLIEEKKISPHLNIDTLSDNGPVFKFAAESGNLDLVKYLLEKHHVDIEAQGQYAGTKDTALGHAAYRGHLEIVNYLLAHHANPNAKTSYASVLTEGIRSRNSAVVEALLVGQAVVTPRDVHYAVEKGNLPVLKLLVAYGGDLTKQYIEPYTVVAANSGNVELLKYLEDEHHLSIFDTIPFQSWRDVKHDMLRAAAESGTVAMMRYLVDIHHLDIQAYVTKENMEKYAYEYNPYETILGRAVAKNMEMVRYLFEDLKLVPPHAALKKLAKEAQFAGSRMNAYLASYLTDSIEDKKFLQTIYEKEIPALDTATLFKLHHSDLVKQGHYGNYSIEVFDEIEKRKLTDEQIKQAAMESKEAAVHMLTYYCSYQFDKDLSKLRLLLEQGYDVNTKDSNGNTLAHIAAYNGGLNNIVQFLLDKGADVDLPNNKGLTLINVLGKQLGSDPSVLLDQPLNCYTNSLKGACSNQFDGSLIPILKHSKGEIGDASPQELVELAFTNRKLIDLLSYVNDSVFQKMQALILSSDFINRHQLTEKQVNELITKSRIKDKNESMELRDILNTSYKILGGYAKLTNLLFSDKNSEQAAETREQSQNRIV